MRCRRQVRESWEKAKAAQPLENLGEHLFQGLATLAPHVIHIFKRPKKIQAMQFVNAVELIVTFNEDPEHFFEELKDLTIRHIKVGVKPVPIPCHRPHPNSAMELPHNVTLPQLTSLPPRCTVWVGGEA